jgi:DNA-nicking Smr family endonuclease
VDFGSILDQWEREQKKNQPKKKTKPPAQGDEVKKAAHPLAEWLGDHEVYDKDAENPDPNEPSAGEQRRQLLAKRPDASIDLHGLTRDEAWTTLEQFFETGQRQGYRKLEIIHGKGNHSQGEAVLKRTVRDFIERCSFAGESGHSSAANGGSGATWVLLK